MKNILLLGLFLFCRLAQAQKDYIKENYDKHIYDIKMRDGVKLHTIIYTPKDKSQRYPFLMKRTCYSIRPYENNTFPSRLGPSKYLMKDKYIFVYQDVRGRYMSEGVYTNMRPQVERKSNKHIDESTDTYDTIDWLVKNIPNNNGKVGMYGISYPGFYTAVGTLSRHPALVASSPQAPISDFYFDDFHHRGSYTLSYWGATPVFGYHKKGKTTKPWYPMQYWIFNTDQYDFFLKLGSLKHLKKYYKQDNFFWNELTSHPNYDEFWQKRSLIPHLKGIKHAVLTVGGFFDAEDLYGPLTIYKTIEKNNPKADNRIVMGPWSHGDWSIKRNEQVIGNVYFGDGINDFYQKKIEKPFFEYHLKGGKKHNLPEAYMYDTGAKKWRQFSHWPPKKAKKKSLYIGKKQKLSFTKTTQKGAKSFISDPNKPVPYSESLRIGFTPRKYMTDDQRFASKRPDVLVFETELLKKDITLTGDILAKLKVATTGTAADWVVKVIDVYPNDTKNHKYNKKGIYMAGYQQMVRSEIIRGRYRKDYSKPEPFIPNKKTSVNLPLQDICHTFKKGHKIMIHIQSTWFPLFDRNPQKYVGNIFEANDYDFVKQTHKVFYDTELEIRVLEK